MYSCNDCGAQFEEPENNACPKCGGGDFFEEDIEEEVTEETSEKEETEETSTMEEVISEADDENKKGLGVSLRRFGEDYIRYKNQMECAKECIKSLFEMAKDKGITKNMIIAYAQAVQLEEFNAKVLCSAVQQELGMEEAPETDDGISQEVSENNELDTENSADGISEENDADTEQSDNQGNE